MKDKQAAVRTWDKDLSHKWTGQVGQNLNLDAGSPTKADESLGQTFRRIGDAVYTAASIGYNVVPDPTILAEANYLCQQHPECLDILNLAMRRGFEDRAATEKPWTAFAKTFPVFTGSSAAIPVLPDNGRQGGALNVYGGSTEGAGEAQMGHVTTTTSPAGGEGEDEEDETVTPDAPK